MAEVSKRKVGRPASGRKESVHLRVDLDVHERFKAVSAVLENGVGFRPTSNQVLKYLLDHYSKHAQG